MLTQKEVTVISFGRIFILYLFLCDGMMSLREHFPLVAISWFQRMAHCKGIWHAPIPFVPSYYCDVLSSNMSVISGFWILYPDLLDKLSGRITINYNTLFLTISTLR
jgi:hypothetical protein